MTRTRWYAVIIMAAFIACTMVPQGAVADQISMIIGRITVNGLPQEDVTVTGFGTYATTTADGTYILKFKDAGYGVINASYNGYNTSSGLIIIPTSPIIKVRDFDIAIPGYSTPANNSSAMAQINPRATSTPVPTIWADIIAPTGVPEPERPQAQALDSAGAIYLMAGVACTFFICFIAYLTIRK